uniref:Secreted protein n=1 Tax=Streptomyces sp. NBC_00003 TaxID=2903608 RepID=A0AAU2VDG8_9ACTN
MQTAAVPELAHTHTRPVHWIATATAMAAVVAIAGFLQPDAAKASQTPGERGTPLTAAAAPDTGAVTFPLDCGSIGSVVEKKASGDLDGDGVPETVAVVHCNAGGGTPPRGIYVLTKPVVKGAPPRVVATLVDPKEKQNVADFAVRDGMVAATLLGYSSNDVPRFEPDVRQEVKWRWQSGKFVRSTGPAAMGV